MRKLLLTVIAVVGMSILQLHAQQLLVGSYNIRYQNESDARNGNGWEQRLRTVCRSAPSPLTRQAVTTERTPVSWTA